VFQAKYGQGDDDNFGAREASVQQLFSNARFAAWFEQMTPLVESGRREFYNLVE
jgi:hypothetical protein